jgi:hypothetical protein
MTRRPTALLAAALLAGALLAGCGGGGSSAGTSAAGQNTSSPPAASSTPTSAAGLAAVTACKQAIQAQTALPQSAKEKLERVCGKAASGDQAAVRKVAREVCEEAINDASIPTSAKEQAKAACASQ